MHQFYCPNELIKNTAVEIHSSQELHHIRNVLRLKPGAKVTVFNNQGQKAQGEIRSISTSEVKIVITNVTQQIQDSGTHIILACAVPKKTKFETIIEKTTELGIKEIYPMLTARTEINLKDARADAKIKRYQTVAVNASKQSKRFFVPIIHPFFKFQDVLTVLKDSSDTAIIIPSLMGERKPLLPTLQNLPNKKKIAFLIGPEGDFTKEEYQSAFEAGAISVSLGETILKVETAAISCIAFTKLFHFSNN